jgi:RecA-family ATPase
MPNGDRLTLTPASEVKPERKRWVLKNRVPQGSLTVLAGQPKQGKSTWTADVAAQVSQGTADGDLHGEPAAVVLLSFEDDFAGTIVPRLIAAGADLSKVHLLNPLATAPDGADRIFSVTQHFAQLTELCERVAPKLLVVDPIMAALGSDTDAHRDQAVRRALAPLAQLAARLDMAALVVAHTNKGRDGDVIRRVGASIGLTGAARSILLMGPDPRDPRGADGLSRVLTSRGNLAASVPALAYELEPTTVEHDGQHFDTARLVYKGEADVDSHELLTAEGQELRGRETTVARRWLRERLEDEEWHESSPLKEEAHADGIVERTLKRAKAELHVEDLRSGFPSTTKWRLPVRPSPVGPTVNGETGPTGVSRSVEREPTTGANQPGHTPRPGPTGADAESV